MNLEYMYDEVESGSTRFVGFLCNDSRFDIAITSTQHFFGKHLVFCLQTNRCAIMNQQDAEDVDYVREAFSLRSDEEAQNLSEFLILNLYA